MSANLQPFSSAGGFITGGNITVSGVASPAPSISGFSSVNTGNISLNGGSINGGTATVVDDGINAIYTGATTTMDVYGFPFSQTTRGQLTISGDIDPTQALGTWYYQSTSTNAFEIFTDSTYSTPVDSTGWGAYGGGGSVAITKQLPASNIVINSNGYLSTFDITGNVLLPNNLSVVGGEIYLTGEGVIRSNYDTVSIQSYDVANNIGYGLRVGDNGGLYLEQGSDPTWLSFVPNAGNAEITAAGGTGGAAGHSISIAAGAADQTGYYTTAGGNINIVGGLGASNDGGGGGPGGSVNISAGNSADPAGVTGNVNIQTGSNTWAFDNTGNLTAPGAITSNELSVLGNTALSGPLTITGGGAVQIGDSTITANSVFGGTATFGPGSVTSTNTMSATGNITGGNLSATGNVYDSRGQLFNVPASYAKYTRNTQQSGSIVANTVVVCNVSENTFGSDISVNTGTGQVTLQAGRTYRLRGGIPGWTGSGGALQWCWYNETTPGWLGESGESYSPSNSAAYGAAGGSAEAVFTPGTTTVVSFRILSASSVTALGGNSDFSTTASYPWIDIQVIGGQAALTGFSTTGNITGGNIFGNGSTLSNVATQVTGTWTVTAGTGNYTITVPANQTYQLWVRGNVPNGIIAYTAMAAVTNTNVPVLGVQYGWNYVAGGNLILNTLPTQFVGTAGSISNAAPAVSNTNVFTFNITNNSGSSQTVDYGWTRIS